eukprot:COSAG01_NODE_23704_length_804_cov_2.696454_2_plen_56_part_01
MAAWWRWFTRPARPGPGCAKYVHPGGTRNAVSAMTFACFAASFAAAFFRSALAASR